MTQFSTAILPACSASAGFDISFRMFFIVSNCHRRSKHSRHSFSRIN